MPNVSLVAPPLVPRFWRGIGLGLLLSAFLWGILGGLYVLALRVVATLWP